MRIYKRHIIFVLVIIVIMLRFLITEDYSGPFERLVKGYLLDILVPFTIYLVAIAFKHPLLRLKQVRALGIFLFGVFIEILQYFNISAFGSKFDVWDIVMYGIGLILGIWFEDHILSLFPGKNEQKKK